MATAFQRPGSPHAEYGTRTVLAMERPRKGHMLSIVPDGSHHLQAAGCGRSGPCRNEPQGESGSELLMSGTRRHGRASTSPGFCHISRRGPDIESAGFQHASDGFIQCIDSARYRSGERCGQLVTTQPYNRRQSFAITQRQPIHDQY